ncbi:MAG: hypothetical protein SGI73_07270 [Chloroflexota bacterium]|nr:hypothetical protein [Chloroflexota bacterium]
MIQVLDLIVRIVLFLLGLNVVIFTILSAVRTFVLPRAVNVPLTRFVARGVRTIFDLRMRLSKVYSYEDRDRIMAMYAPVMLLSIPVAWLILVMLGYTLMYYAIGLPTIHEAFRLSGSSLLTLGFFVSDGPPLLLEFSEAMVGMILTALLIGYLPTMYSAFSQRETLVSKLSVRAGTPPSAVEMLARIHRQRGLDSVPDLLAEWENWFVIVEETHTSLSALVFFRSPKPDQSWITAAGVILDTASLYLSTVDHQPNVVQVPLTIRAGFMALRHIATFFRIPYNSEPKPGDPISISRQEFDAAYNELVAQGVPVKADREQAWKDFAGWRVNYDVPLLALAALTMAPYASWVSDRSLPTPVRQRLRVGNGNGKP